MDGSPSNERSRRSHVSLSNLFHREAAISGKQRSETETGNLFFPAITCDDVHVCVHVYLMHVYLMHVMAAVQRQELPLATFKKEHTREQHEDKS